jgi:probable selenium-dependent hydroxylase accessory protein YqeC
MYAMARLCCGLNRRVLVSTTTHIGAPPDGLYAGSLDEVLSRWAEGRPAVVGQPTAEGKLTMLPWGALEEYMSLADIVFLESDGAKRLPLKVPADREPVLLPQSDIVLAVCGLTSVARPLGQVCFRLEKAEALLGKRAEEPVTEEDLARILASESGGRKGVGPRDYYMVANQCDDVLRLAQAGRVACALRVLGWEKLTATCLSEPEQENDQNEYQRER